MPAQLYRQGDRGPAVAEIRQRLIGLRLLAAGPDPDPGDRFDAACDRAVRGFQQGRGLRADGIVGPETYRALDEARWRLGDRLLSYTVSRPFVGDDVVELQRRLLQMGFDPGRLDGIFGRETEAALRDFQRNYGLPPDGTCGPRTLKALDRLARTVVGGAPDRMREEERLLQAGPTVAGKVVVIDPGHGGPDRGAQTPGQDEAGIVEDVAAKLEGRLGAIGVVAYLTRGADSCPTEEERAAFANDTAADLFVSLHLDAAPSPLANGVATYFYGDAAYHAEAGFGGARDRRGTGSTTGHRLATLAQREITNRTDLLDCRVHPKTWTLLRATRMPAIRVDLGYLTNPGDAGRLASPALRDAVAEALAAAVQQLYLPEGDVSVGQLRIPALLG